jgi:hypothetical protein
MTLDDLMVHVGRYARGELDLDAVHDLLAPVLAADPLDVEESDAGAWEHAADETRLFWRVVYLLETGRDDATLRAAAARVGACLASTRDADVTYELLPLVLDAERLASIVRKHLDGTISRTGFLNVVVESGYAPHAKLWLQHASADALRRLVGWLDVDAYGELASALEQRPA